MLRVWFRALVRELRAEARTIRATSMDSTFPSLVLASLGATGRRDRVFWVGLPPAPPSLTVRALDFDDRDHVTVEVAGEPGSAGT